MRTPMIYSADQIKCWNVQSAGKKWIVDTGKTYVLAWNQFTKKNICRLDGFHWTGRCIGLVGRRRMKDERLEMLSDKVRKGVPIDFSEELRL